ncbi:hypothetical protein BDZ94DRAFT_1200025 [Collybia nuda]|uniref:Snurportin-1 n=1 Tax=Collybia nuda TaxID=64659 RepID=A0A9P6CEF7_9AGAR|nr:hypothetical protein BDZ94DRAFT_1200025 [Collybia nuda]
MTADRKMSYKVPPTTITDKLVSQEARRGKALEEQKRRRAQRVDSSRQLDLFADLNLGPSDEEDASHSPEGATGVSLASVAPYAAMLEHNVTPDSVIDPIKLPQFQIREAQKDGFRKSKKKRKNRNNKTSKWADKCMYAELLEMAPDDPWSTIGSNNDGLPNDLESGWVAVGPVPVGKRCLAVTHQSSGIAGVAPNTTLRSRLLGKLLIQRFPSNLPPLTILDCILDSNWRHNGILHVLDVVKWKGQDVGDCETPFRLWWRDTRLTELAQSTPLVIPPTASAITQNGPPQYQFPYPTTFLPIPYHTDTTLSALSDHVIPFARSSRSINVNVPTLEAPSPIEGSMEIDTASRLTNAPVSLVSVSTSVPSDGLLLYVAEASYEAGTSPLSSWIPITNHSDDHSVENKSPQTSSSNSEGPLDVFQRLVEWRLSNRKPQRSRHEVTMDMEI